MVPFTAVVTLKNEGFGGGGEVKSAIWEYVRHF